MPWHHDLSKRELKRKKREAEKLARKKKKQERRRRKDGPLTIAPQPRTSRRPQTATKWSPPARSKAPAYPASVLKGHYRVDILAAIYLDELVKGSGVTFKNKIPDKAAAGIAFYEGVQLAADSLKKKNFNIDIYIHDVASALESPDTLLKYRALDSSDLIIAAVPPQNLPAVAAFAAKKHINLVSALSPADGGVRGNKFFTLLQPSLHTHCESILQKLPQGQGNVTLLYRNTITGEDNAYKYLTEDTITAASWNRLNCNRLPTSIDLPDSRDTAQVQYLVMPILDPAYADSLLKVVLKNAPKGRLEIYGMPTWTALNLQKRSAANPNIVFVLPEPYYADTAGAAYKVLAEKYEAAYGGNLKDLAVRGYETMYLFGTMLKKYGTVFNPKFHDCLKSQFTKFDLTPHWDATGKFLYNENRHVYRVRYAKGVVQVGE